MSDGERFDLMAVVGKLIRADLRPVRALNKELVIVLEELNASERKQSDLPPVQKLGDGGGGRSI